MTLNLRRLVVLLLAALLTLAASPALAAGPPAYPPGMPLPPGSARGLSVNNPAPLRVDARTGKVLNLPSQAGHPASGTGATTVYPPGSPGPLNYRFGGSTEFQGAGIYNLYWGAFPSGYQSGVQGFESNLQAQNGRWQYDFRGLMTQYYDNWGAGNYYINPYLYVSANAVDNNPMVNGCSDPWFARCVTGDQITTELRNWANANGYSMGAGSIFVMHIGPGIGVDGNFLHQWCGVHGYAGQFTYIIIPDQAQNSPVVNGSYGTCDAQQRPITGNHTQGTNGDFEATANVFSHELDETYSDPYINAWIASNGGEIGDLCQWLFGTKEGSSGGYYTIRANGQPYYVQTEYSNRDGGCINALPS